MFPDYGNRNLRVRVLNKNVIFDKVYNHLRNLREQVPFLLISRPSPASFCPGRLMSYPGRFMHKTKKRQKFWYGSIRRSG